MYINGAKGGSLIRGFLGFLTASVRWKFLTLLNLSFFGCVFITALSAGLLFPCPLYSGARPTTEIFPRDAFLMILGIFFSNLVLSAFIFVTLPGIVFFPLSIILLLFRAVLWGLEQYFSPTWLFLVSLPTLVLEGEAYVFAAEAGIIAGVSWIKPRWIYPNEDVSRIESFKRASKECLRLYILVAVFLFLAAVVEMVTISMI
jgi:hypothetical protein